MTKKIVIIISFIGVLVASYMLGTMVAETPKTDSINDTVFLEVMDQLMENHYLQPSKEELLEGAIDGMIESLDDPFTTYFDYEEAQQYQQGFGEAYVGIGITVRFSDDLIVVEAVKEDGPAENAGIRVNDIISSVDGTSVIGLPYYETIGMIIGDEGTEVTIGIDRPGVEETINLTMTRSVIDSATVIFESFTRGDQLIGYIKVTTFGDETANLFVNALADLETQGIDSLIIDLRNNGGGHLSTVANMLNQFLVDDGSPMFSTEYFVDGEYIRDDYFAIRVEPRAYEIVTLVNENSASASEVFASAMQEHGGYQVYGQTTYGKGTMQRDILVTATIGDILHITIGKWYTSDGNWVHFDGGTDGVIPDVIVETTDTERAYKVFLLEEDSEILFDTVDSKIANIQLILNIMGYTVRTDGYYDDATKLAILDIQNTNGLLETGNIDSDTLVIINEALDLFQDDLLNDTQLEAIITYLTND